MSLRFCTTSSQSLRPHLRLTHQIRFLSTPPPSSTQPEIQDVKPTSTSNQDEEIYEPSLRQRITTAVKETFDKQKNLERRAEIKKEMQQSYWKDFKELNQTGGKLYEAASRLLKEQRSIKFPQIKVTPLNQSDDINLIKKLEGKISLVSFCFVQYGEKHIQSFADPFRNEFSGVDGVQQIEINAQETWMKSAIVKMCLPQLRRQIPKDRQPFYYTSLFKKLKPQKEILNISNNYLGWVFLVDNNCKIRWFAHGQATEKEIESMKELTWILVERMKERSLKKP